MSIAVWSSRAAALGLCLTACAPTAPAVDGSVDVAARDVVAAEGSVDALTQDAAAPRDAESADAQGADAAVSVDAASTAAEVFVAQGYMGRTMVSCDDGASWRGNRSDDDAVRCFTDGVDCDHNGGRAMGIAAIGGAFVATWGWGEANSVRRSVDGVTWQRVIDASVFSGLAASDRVVAVFGDRPRASTDNGATWSASGASIGFRGHIRGSGAVTVGSVRFIAAGGENGSAVGDVMVSDDGVAWRRPTSIPMPCGQGVVPDGVRSGGGVALIVHESGLVCRSRDGVTWTSFMAPVRFKASLLYTGSTFVSWGNLGAGPVVRAESVDGERWTTTPLTATNASGATASVPNLGPIARSSAGTFVAVESGWQRWYAMQKFYRSADGAAWRELPSTAYVGSHPVRFIASGTLAQGSTLCR